MWLVKLMYAKRVRDVHGEQQCLVSWPAILCYLVSVGASPAQVQPCPLDLCQVGAVHTSGGKCINSQVFISTKCG